MRLANSSQFAPAWARNLLFFGVAATSLSVLFAFLFPTNTIRQPLALQEMGESVLADIATTAGRVDDAFELEREQNGLNAAPLADELTIARRLSLGLAGTLPSLQEIRAFESQPVGMRLSWWVSRLLEDERTADFVAERWARSLVSVDEGPFVIFRRRRFVNWLSKNFATNTPYDDWVQDLLVGEGLWTDTPEVNFYSKTIAEENVDPVVLAGKTSRAFLGMRIDCLQCHDDFLGTINLGSAEDPTGGTQVDFHHLASFFGQMEASVFGIRANTEKKPYEYRLLDEDKPAKIEPKVPFYSELVDTTLEPRPRLAHWVTHPENRQFSRATVNRCWAIMTGRALIEPVDDIPLAGPFPAAMEILADDFIRHDFDYHRLIRVIAQTQTFRRSSEAAFEITEQHLNSGGRVPDAKTAS